MIKKCVWAGQTQKNDVETSLFLQAFSYKTKYRTNEHFDLMMTVDEKLFILKGNTFYGNPSSSC